jgi:nucleoid-associated protein YgaU
MIFRTAAFFLVMIAALVGLETSKVEAAPPIAESGQAYVVQADDWLGTLADKFYGSPLAYPVIVEATNARASQDERYSSIEEPGQVSIGQVLFVPEMDDIPDELLASAPLTRETVDPAPVVSGPAPTDEQLQLLASLDEKGTPPELLNEVWLNSEPLKLADLHGKVVIVEFWTFG